MVHAVKAIVGIFMQHALYIYIYIKQGKVIIHAKQRLE